MAIKTHRIALFAGTLLVTMGACGEDGATNNYYLPATTTGGAGGEGGTSGQGGTSGESGASGIGGTAGSSSGCGKLALCCAAIAGEMKSGCNAIVDTNTGTANGDSVCNSAYPSFSSHCESTAEGGSGGSGSAGSGGAGDGGSAGSGGSGGSESPAGNAGSGGSDSTGGTGGGEQCSTNDYFVQRLSASILLVIDRSGSMQDGGKWAGTTNAISSMVDTSDAQLGMGILRFPEGNYDSSKEALCMTSVLMGNADANCKAAVADGGCKDINTTPNVTVGPLQDTRSPIKALLTSTKPIGNTPTRWALRNAWEHMKGLKVNGEKYVLLLTDGEPTTKADMFGTPSRVECGQLSDIANETWSASHDATNPIRTFVIGAPGSESNLEILSGIASNGGTGKPNCSPSAGNCHYQISSFSFQEDLKNALSEIVEKTSTCVYLMPPANDNETDPKLVNVYASVNGSDALISRDTSHNNGWDYTDGTHKRIELYGSQCEALKKSAVSTVKIAVGCSTIGN